MLADDDQIEEQTLSVSIESPRLLVVEGRDDELLFNALMRHEGVHGVQTVNMRGVSNMRRLLGVLSRLPAFNDEVEFLAVVRDADRNSEDTLRSVRDALAASGLPAPTGSLQPTGATPKIVVLVVPHGRNSGAIEDVCLASVEEDSAISCIDDLFECVKNTMPQEPNNLSKARVQAFLASRRRPGLRLGEAAEAGYWRWDHAAFDPLKQLLRLLQ